MADAQFNHLRFHCISIKFSTFRWSLTCISSKSSCLLRRSSISSFCCSGVSSAN